MRRAYHRSQSVQMATLSRRHYHVVCALVSPLPYLVAQMGEMTRERGLAIMVNGERHGVLPAVSLAVRLSRICTSCHPCRTTAGVRTANNGGPDPSPCCWG